MATRNDFSIAQLVNNSRVDASDFRSRALPNASRGRSSINQTIQKWKSNNAAIKAFKFPLDVPKYYMTIDISEYSRNNLFSLNFDQMFTIVLPMPNQLVTSNQISYEEAQLGTVPGTLADAGYEYGKNAEARKETLQGDQNSLKQLEELKKQQNEANRIFGETLQGIGVGIARALMPKSLEDFAAVLSGYSPNQYFTVLLRGPTYNQYQFMWYLMPRNHRESDQIRDIVEILNNAKAPGLAAGGGLWSFPKIFRLAYYPNSMYLNKFKPSVMTELQVNFAPGGSPAFYATNGQPNPPEGVVISATFKELEYWLDGDYISDNDPFHTQGVQR